MQHRRVVFVDQAASVGRHVEKKHAVAAHVPDVHVPERVCRLDLAVFLGVVEPAGADRDIGLGRIPEEVRCALDLRAAAQVVGRQVAAVELVEGTCDGRTLHSVCRVWADSLPTQRTSGPIPKMTAPGWSCRINAYQAK